MPGETTPAPAQADTKPPDGKPDAEQKTGEDIFEVILEGIEKPVKVPLKSIPADKLDPHLAKLRADADRKASEADLKLKQASDKSGAIEKLFARVKQDPAALDEMARELGITDEQLDAMSEKRFTQRVKQLMRDAEEEKDPGKKSAREAEEDRERLRKENEELKGKQSKEAAARARQQVEGVIMQGLEKLPQKLRTPLAAQEMVVFLQASIDAKTEELGRSAGLEDLTIGIDDLVKAARDGWRSAATAYWEADEAEELPDHILKRAEAQLAKRAAAAQKHPSDPRGSTQGTVPAAKKRQVNGEEPPANRVLSMLR